ncbi:Triacylglycerol lipase 2 [Morella rubra]|uniref:Lipase n=1 Tax=Morella rubra TaxID=262757 RepID=A0A6A1VGD0_9ROSI|nr:Triacylglycerol lipase 2 [Morella rubra]
MAVIRGMLGLAAAWGFCVLVFVLAVQPHHAHGSSRGSFGLNKGVVTPPVAGICASSVLVHGYKCQELEVTTKDGYILSVQRIPEGRVPGGGNNRRQPVLIQHGVLVDGMTWFLNPPEQNLPMILADNGFDVWIANTRGTRFSRRHTTLDPDKPAFWSWSWDELVSFDLPAVFDFVYGQTGQKIDYVGHSLGTLIALASFSEGKLVNQLKSAALLSPIAYLSHMNTALGVVAAKAFVGESQHDRNAWFCQQITTLVGLAEFNPKGKPVAKFLKSLCAYPGVDCYDLLSALTGKNCCLNSSTVDLFLMNEPQSTSTKNMVHLAQTVRHGVVSKFNYGRPDYNVMHYGEASPPIYNLSNIPHDLPLFISYGGQDALSDVRDVMLLLDSFKFHNVDKLSVQFIKDYAHADFIMGVNAKDMVYNQVVAFFKHQNQ